MRWPFRKEALRAAPFGVYTGFGRSLLPRLDQRGRRPKPIITGLRENPVTFGPLYRVSIRMGALPIKTYSLDPETRRRTENLEHPGYELLRSPNPVHSRPLLVAGTVLSMLTRSFGAVWLKVRPGPGRPPDELWPMPPNVIAIDTDGRSAVRGFVVKGLDGKDRPIPLSEFCWFRLLPDVDSWAEGIAPLEPLSGVAEMGAEAIGATTDFYTEGIFGRQWFEADEVLSDEAVERLTAQWDASKSRRWRKPIVEPPLKLNQSDPIDPAAVASGIETATAIVKQVLGTDTDDRQVYYAEVIQPLAEFIEQELERSLFSEWPQDKAFPEFGFRDILRGDPKERAEAWARQILTAQATPREARLDWNREPVEGDDHLLVPLNLELLRRIAVAPNAEPRAKDSGDGLGGDEGKGTLALTPPQTPNGQRRAAGSIIRAWGTTRSRVIRGQSNALRNRVRGVLKTEHRDLAREFAPPSRSAVRPLRAGDAGLPPIGELQRRIRQSDPEVERLLAAFMDQTSEEAWTAAGALLDADVGEVHSRIGEVVSSRARVVAERFGQVREDQLTSLFREAMEEGLRVRDLGARVAELYDSLAVNFVDGIARTEVAFAHEQAALLSWAQAGIDQMEFVFGGGPCTTGVCEEAAKAESYRLGEPTGDVGASFEDADAPPLHPGCTCFAVPFVPAELAAEVSAGE
jgi:hypothetical protein